MRVCILALFLLMAASFLSAAAQSDTTASEPTVELPAALARVLSDYEAAWVRKDAAALASLFVADGLALPAGRPAVRGRAAIEKHYAGAGGPLALRAIAFGAKGNIGYIIGGYARAKGEPDHGKFTVTLRKGAGGRWLIVSDMDSPNQQRSGH